MSRCRACVAVALLVVLAGCGGTDDRGRTTTALATEPVPTLGPTAYPDRPPTPSTAGVREFVVDCERAYLQNEENTMATNVSLTIESTVEETDGGAFVVALHVEGVVRYADGHGDVVHDAYYFVNDSTVLRTEVPEGEAAPDPGSGTVVPCA